MNPNPFRVWSVALGGLGLVLLAVLTDQTVRLKRSVEALTAADRHLRELLRLHRLGADQRLEAVASIAVAPRCSFYLLQPDELHDMVPAMRGCNLHAYGALAFAVAQRSPCRMGTISEASAVVLPPIFSVRTGCWGSSDLMNRGPEGYPLFDDDRVRYNISCGLTTEILPHVDKVIKEHARCRMHIPGAIARLREVHPEVKRVLVIDDAQDDHAALLHPLARAAQTADVRVSWARMMQTSASRTAPARSSHRTPCRCPRAQWPPSCSSEPATRAQATRGKNAILHRVRRAPAEVVHPTSSAHPSLGEPRWATKFRVGQLLDGQR